MLDTREPLALDCLKAHSRTAFPESDPTKTCFRRRACSWKGGGEMLFFRLLFVATLWVLNNLAFTIPLLLTLSRKSAGRRKKKKEGSSHDPRHAAPRKGDRFRARLLHHDFCLHLVSDAGQPRAAQARVSHFRGGLQDAESGSPCRNVTPAASCPPSSLKVGSRQEDPLKNNKERELSIRTPTQNRVGEDGPHIS